MSEEHERRPIDWGSIGDELTQYGHELIDRLSNKTKENAGLAQKGEYRVDNLLDDVKCFWKNLAGDIDRGVDWWRDKVLRRTDVS